MARMKRPKPAPPIAAAVPSAGEGKRGETGYLAYLLRQAAGAVRLRLERRLADLEVTVPQFVVLTMLNSYPGASGADIARLAWLTPQTVHGIVVHLEKAGLVGRVEHPVHQRIQMLTLTAAGQRVLARCRQIARKVEAELAAGLSREEERVIRRWLITIAVQTRE
jgi:DNA-binding MarR family transcriptional regulator